MEITCRIFKDILNKGVDIIREGSKANYLWPITFILKFRSVDLFRNYIKVNIWL